MRVQIQILDKELYADLADGVPQYATPGSAAVDLRACQNVQLWPGERYLMKTGVAIALPEPDRFAYAAMLLPRSGLAVKHGLTLSNTPGLIDSDYRGEIKAALWLAMDQEYTTPEQAPLHIARGDRIAQLVIVPVIQAQFEIVDSLTASQRGAGGFGSTGR